MTKRRVQLFGQSRGIEIDTAATDGAVVGVNLRWPNGQLVTEDDFGGSAAEDPGVTYWRLIMEIPPNVTALEGTVGAGLYAITGNGTSATRTIEAVAGELTVEDGDGVAGNPRLGLADVEVAAGGSLERLGFDAKGRLSERGDATTDDLVEGGSNLYYTDERADDRVEAGIDAHVADPDPHPQYLTRDDAEGMVIPTTQPTDADILEYSSSAGGWVPSKATRQLYLDGGNF